MVRATGPPLDMLQDIRFRCLRCRKRTRNKPAAIPLSGNPADGTEKTGIKYRSPIRSVSRVRLRATFHASNRGISKDAAKDLRFCRSE